MGWQITGTLGAICYQIATKTVWRLTKWVKGLSRGGISPTNFQARARPGGLTVCELKPLPCRPGVAACAVLPNRSDPDPLVAWELEL